MKLERTQSLGSTGLLCPALGLGTGRLASMSGGLSARQAEHLLRTAAELGVTLIDTSDSYGQGGAERMIGRAIQGQRENFIVTTKAGYSFGSPPWWLRAARPILQPLARHLRALRSLVKKARHAAPGAGVLRQDFAAETIVARLEASLQRLGCSEVDVFFLHDATLAAVQDDALWVELAKQRAAGKVRALGVSTNQLEVLEAALQRADVQVLQTAVNPRRTEAVRRILPAAAARGVGVIANQCFLAGKLEDAELAGVRARIDAAAQAHLCSPAQILLAFARQQPAVATVLTGTLRAERLRENVADLAAAPRLTAEELERLRAP
jgi:aryl-alcohol dehydrogenase-like predicted oxidoreductase